MIVLQMVICRHPQNAEQAQEIVIQLNIVQAQVQTVRQMQNQQQNAEQVQETAMLLNIVME